MSKNKTRKKSTFTYNDTDYKSSDGMLTTVWGPALWHYTHVMSFNYPVEPTEENKKEYKNFILNLKYLLPCKYCRVNFKKNLKQLPITASDMKNREAFSRYVYNLHELINTMLNKKSGLSYVDVKERYEHFRARCVINKPRRKKTLKIVKEIGCTEPLYGKKSKCIIKIVPQDNKGTTFQIDKKCIKRRV